jgi:hypothetical protein
VGIADDYSDAAFANYSIPEAEEIGHWWRRRWTVDLARGVTGGCPIPPPMIETDTSGMFVSAWWKSDSHLLIDTYTRDEELHDGELVFVSVIGAWLRYRFAPVEVRLQGSSRHPVLTMSRLDENLVEALRAQGY